LVVDRVILEKRLLKLERAIHKLKGLSQVSWERFMEDEGIRDRAERNLQTAIQVCIDMGNHIIADSGYRTPSSYADIFDVLREEGLLEECLASTMKRMTGFRNVLVHEYLDINPEIVHESLSRLDDFRAFANCVYEWISRQ